jgi:ketosteroid isomerase-like protein
MRAFLAAIPLAVLALSCNEPEDRAAAPESGTSQEASLAGGADSATIVKLHREWIRAFQEHDPKLLDPILADDFVAYFPEPVTKQQYLEATRDTSMKVESVTDDELRVRVLGSGGDVALVTGLATQKGREQGQAGSHQNRYTEVWVKRAGRWQCLVEQLQAVAPKS